jgi:DNA-binding LytR/AlgR family response regulator
MKTKCLIVDDEPLAIEVIQSHIEKISTLNLIASCNNAMEAFDILTQKNIDLMFLDIQMPKLKGTDFVKNLKNPPKVILTTAYREYALEGYELDVVDYLLKPVSFERFFRAINKFYQQSIPATLVQSAMPENSGERYIYLRANKKIHRVREEDILYAESLKDYIIVHTTSQKITTKQTFTAFEELLPDQGFMRIHRSYLVALNKITGFTASTIEIGETELPIGRNYRQQVYSTLNYGKARNGGSFLV